MTQKIKSLDESPILKYRGRLIEIDSDGTSAGTHVKIDGKEMLTLQKLIVKLIVPNNVSVDMEMLDVKIITASDGSRWIEHENRSHQ